MKVYVIRREDGLGGAEAAARRITDFLSDHFDVQRIKGGDFIDKWNFGGNKGSGWFKTLDFAKKVNLYFQNSSENSIILSLERGIKCDIYRAGDGVHKKFIDIKYTNPIKKWVKPINWVAISLEKFTMKNSKVIIANSHMVKDDLLTHYPWLKNNVKVIHNGVDPSVYHFTNTKSSQKKTFLFVGHDWKRKGLIECLSICQHYKESVSPNFELLILGKGDSNKYTSMIQQYKLNEQIKFLGSQENISKYYNQGHALILPTLYDPFSNACLEAMACGCAVVTTANNGIVDYIKHNQTGFILKKGSTLDQTCHFLSSELDHQSIANLSKQLNANEEFENIKSLIQELSLTK